MTEDDRQLTSAIRDLKQTVDSLRVELVRKDVYNAERKADRAEVDALKEDVGELKGTLTWLSRALVTSLLMPLISTVIIIYVLRQGA